MKNINEISREDLKLTLLGKNNYLFLINDSNHELDQHFNPKYENEFNKDLFLENYNFKKDLFSKYNFEYYYFVVPDKSVVCSEFLPFNYDILKRNVDVIENIVDFIDCLSVDDYFQFDSHINFKGAKKLSFKLLNYINKEFSIDKFNQLINKSDEIEVNRNFDLLFEKNWSYSENFKKEFPLNNTYNVPKSKSIEEKDIPKIFQLCRNRKSIYYKNKDSFSNLKVLIFGDSTFEMFAPFLSLYFNELFFYWDHGGINPDVIRWYNPDLIIELRMERFLENMPVPEWISNKLNCDLSNQFLLDKLLFENYEYNKKIVKLSDKNRKLKKTINSKNKLIDSMINSKSWKLTMSLRKFRKIIFFWRK